jgi:hypothetical protein
MLLRTLRHAVAVAAGALLVAAGVALAAATLPRAGEAYDVGRSVAKGANLTLITSVRNPRQLLAGPANPPIGSQYALSTGAVPCRRAKRTTTLPKSEVPFALFAFPGATLRLSHGSYRFAVARTAHQVTILGSTAKPITLRVAVTGVVRNATTIAGTITPSGGPCTSRPIPYVAKLNPKDRIAPQIAGLS